MAVPAQHGQLQTKLVGGGLQMKSSHTADVVDYKQSLVWTTNPSVVDYKRTLVWTTNPSVVDRKRSPVWTTSEI